MLIKSVSHKSWFKNIYGYTWYLQKNTFVKFSLCLASYFAEPIVVPQNFNVTTVLGPKTAEFAWDPVEGGVENIKGAFVGYKVNKSHCVVLMHASCLGRFLIK